MDFYVYRFNDFGKNRIKSFNVSPDAFLQLMLQLTYFKYVRIKTLQPRIDILKTWSMK